jgi:hypothetical protein
MATANSIARAEDAATMSPGMLREELFIALSTGMEGFMKLGNFFNVIGRLLPDDEADLIGVVKTAENIAADYFDSFDRQRTTFDNAFNPKAGSES